jgi:Flp pilus assembly protein TadG
MRSRLAHVAAWRGLRGERGSVSVEAAFAICALVAVLAMAVGGISMVVAQVRCIDAAREAARLVARGEQVRAAEVVRQVAPSDARVSIQIAGDEVTVEVSTEPVGGLLPALTVRAEALAILEPGVGGVR